MPKCLPDFPAASSRVEVPRPFVTWNKNWGRRGESVFFGCWRTKWHFFGGWFVSTTLEHDVFVSEDSSWFRKNWNWWHVGTKINDSWRSETFMHYDCWFLLESAWLGSPRKRCPSVSNMHMYNLIVLSSLLWSWQTRKPEQNACSKKDKTAGWKFSLGF